MFTSGDGCSSWFGLVSLRHPRSASFAMGRHTPEQVCPAGGAFAIVKEGAAIRIGSGGSKSTTNNQMEVRAALEGLLLASSLRHENEVVELVSDSRHALEIAAGSALPAKHSEEAAALRAAFLRIGARTRWVPGHAGDFWNERVDALAHTAKQTFVPARVRRKAAGRTAAKAISEDPSPQ